MRTTLSAFALTLVLLVSAAAVGQAIFGGVLLPKKYATTASLPTCSASLPGGMVWDAEAGKLKVCDGASAWAVAGSGSATMARLWGPFSAANYFKLGTGSDVLDFATNFIICVRFKRNLTTGTANPVVLSNGDGTSGWFMEIIDNTPYDNFQFTTRSGGSSYGVSGGATLRTTFNTVCGGRNGTTLYMKTNGSTTLSTASTNYTPNTTQAALIGAWSALSLVADSVKITAVYGSTTAWAEGTVTTIMAGVDQAAQRFTTEAGEVMNCSGSDFDGTTLTCKTGSSWTTVGTIPYTDPG